MLVFNITYGLVHATPKFFKVYYKIETQIKDGDPECFFSLSHTCGKMKNIFLYFFTKLKTYHLLILFAKHDATDIADLKSMQSVCHI